MSITNPCDSILSCDTLEDLAKSGIDAETARLLQIRETEEGYEIPYPDLSTGELTEFARLRLKTPKGKQRYSQPPGTRTPLYIPGLLLDKEETLRKFGDTNCPIWMVEGEKKAVLFHLLFGQDVLVVGISGCWAWSYDGSLLPDFDRFKLNERYTYVGFDGDVSTKKQVALGQQKLGEALQERQAHVLLCSPRQGKLDDFLMAGGSIEELIHTAKEVERTTNENDLEPWPESVTLKWVLDDAVKLLQKYLVFPKYGAEAAALWAAHTFIYQRFHVTPRLVFTSPVKGCGKTNGMFVVGKMTEKPCQIVGVTSATPYRLIEQYHPTLLIDEADAGTLDNETLRGILNAGYSKPSANVPRCVGANFDNVKLFDVYGPVAMALIGAMNGKWDTLKDRSIEIKMRRKTKHEYVELLDYEEVKRAAEPIKRKFKRWAQDNDIDKKPSLPDSLRDRVQDNWRPLIAIADAAGGEWPRIARETAIALSEIDQAEEDGIGAALLLDIREVFDGHQDNYIGATDLANRLNIIENRPWGTYRRGNGISARWLAMELSRFGIKSRPRHQSNVYTESDFKDTWERYLSLAEDTEIQRRIESENLRQGQVSEKKAVASDFGKSSGGSKKEPPPDLNVAPEEVSSSLYIVSGGCSSKERGTPSSPPRLSGEPGGVSSGPFGGAKLLSSAENEQGQSNQGVQLAEDLKKNLRQTSAKLNHPPLRRPYTKPALKKLGYAPIDLLRTFNIGVPQRLNGYNIPVDIFMKAVSGDRSVLHRLELEAVPF